MKKSLVVVLLLFFCFSLFPLASTPLAPYEPYQEDEFPLWSYKLRRGEIIFFGSFVITMAVAGLGYSLAAKAGWVPPVTDDPLKALFIQAGIASGLSLGIAVADYIIGEKEAP